MNKPDISRRIGKHPVLFILLIATGIAFYFFRHPGNPAASKLPIASRSNSHEIITAQQTIMPVKNASSAFSSDLQPSQEENTSKITPATSIVNVPATTQDTSNAPLIRSASPKHIKAFTDLTRFAKAEIFHTRADLLNGLQNINEFRPNASESIWNGNYIGEIGWPDQVPTGHLKRWPAIVNLEFKRPNEASPLTCFAVLRNQRLLRFTKAAGKFSPLSDPNRNNYFVFRVGTTHFLQILLSDDLLGFAATAYIDDPEKGLIPVSFGLFKRNKTPTPEEASCE